MTIASYSDLIAEVGNYLARDDLTARVPEFIMLAEAKFNRELRCRQMESRSTLTTSTLSLEPAYLTLPVDFQTMRSVCLVTATDKPRLEFLGDDRIKDYRSNIGDLTAKPRYFGLYGTQIELVPRPDANYGLELVYRANVPALNAGNPTNWLMALAPDAYLYGTLLETAPYMKEDPRIEVWAAGLKSAIDGLNRLSAEEAI